MDNLGFRALLRPARNALAGAFGLSSASREACIRTMLDRHRCDTVSYWFQLLVAMGLATLGLALDSAAVVIGAMLISPLMGPIVELGMGLAIGSAVLAIRAMLRTVLSIAGVIGAAALLTAALPFDQLTRETLARTSPTVLDLFIAALCALVAGYTTVRSSTETTATAAAPRSASLRFHPFGRLWNWKLALGAVEGRRLALHRQSMRDFGPDGSDVPRPRIRRHRRRRVGA